MKVYDTRIPMPLIGCVLYMVVPDVVRRNAINRTAERHSRTYARKTRCCIGLNVISAFTNTNTLDYRTDFVGLLLCLI